MILRICTLSSVLMAHGFAHETYFVPQNALSCTNGLRKALSYLYRLSPVPSAFEIPFRSAPVRRAIVKPFRTAGVTFSGTSHARK